ncbi:Methane oxygenase PmoA [Granulicella pectinivorans]|uniref:Methane oxygenase PmoA n=1 Tax=Granulicella pectinivorans TaxID=474950 RepID=A0A1I6LL37_9BACT|nr:PmoA family protein [Granulicella pectinivorans]SFS03990.1 Methane oxygenase PmoA [Granulicella pectinivorans]
MSKALRLGVAALSMGMALAAHAQVKVTSNEAQRRVDVTIDGQRFTSYMWPTSLEKPVLYPLIAPDGTTVSRGYPLEPRDKERVDHPHHAGMWFNYGNVNGFDFWNNSDAIKPEQKPKMGSIKMDKIVSTKSGKDKGELVVESTWTTGTGVDILKETDRFVFSKRNGARVIDRVTTLKALDKAVFNDDKEGVLGIRVASFLESPTEKGGIFMDAAGNPTKVADADTSKATGVYRTSEGIEGDKVWSTRGKWCTLTGTTDGKTETIAILDHTGNPGYPTYWHARGYGLFAANPLGDHIFDPKAKEHKMTIEKGGSVTFKYRVLFYSHAAGADEMNKESAKFDAEY